MKRIDKARAIGEILDGLFPRPDIPLGHRDPYTLLVAVVLSAQTTDLAVNKVTPGLFALADNPRDMAELPVSTIQRLIKSIGLSATKARNIRRLSRQLVERHGGEVPRSFEELEALPGVGHKTASVVMAQAFSVPAFPVDTHIHRLAARWGLSRGSSVIQTERDLKKLFPEDEWNLRHLQMIYFGRRYCPARNHDFDACPICSWAASRARIKRESSSSSARKKR